MLIWRKKIIKVLHLVKIGTISEGHLSLIISEIMLPKVQDQHNLLKNLGPNRISTWLTGKKNRKQRRLNRKLSNSLILANKHHPQKKFSLMTFSHKTLKSKHQLLLINNNSTPWWRRILSRKNSIPCKIYLPQWMFKGQPLKHSKKVV